MTDEERQYEMCDSRSFTLPNEIDVSKKHMGDQTYQSTQLGYENPVALHNVPCSHIYESPSSVPTMQEEAQRGGPRQRARINQVYEGFDSDEDLNKTMIFEAIRNIDHHDSDERKKQCQMGCFSVFSLIVLLLISLTASAYIFYMEMTQPRRCSCGAKVQAVFGESAHQKNKTQEADVILHSEKIRQLQETVKFLENTFNHIKFQMPEMYKILKNTTTQLSKMNNSLNSGNYWAHSLKEVNNVFDKKFLTFSKNVSWMKDQLNETKTLVNSRKLEIKLNRMNNTINDQVATLKNKIARKKGFRDCTFATKTEKNVFQQSKFGEVVMNEPANHKIIGVTCASTMDGKTQYSHLVVKENGKITYKCECSTINESKSANSSECIMYYWQCPNN